MRNAPLSSSHLQRDAFSLAFVYSVFGKGSPLKGREVSLTVKPLCYARLRRNNASAGTPLRNNIQVEASGMTEANTTKS
jgi:hypothetical protein